MSVTSTFQLLLSLAILLWTARFLGEAMKQLGFPAIIGEIGAGVLLGTTVFGRMAPDLFSSLFPTEGMIASFYQGFAQLAAVFLLFVAGFEIKVARGEGIWKGALWVGGFGILFPFALGYFAVQFYPDAFGREPGNDPTRFALFLATAMSISALPVIFRTLFDLKLHRARIGAVILAGAVLSDLVGWTVFSAILGESRTREWDVVLALQKLAIAAVFAVAMLILAPPLFARILPWLKRRTERILSYCLGIALLAGAGTELFGLHALFGALIAGAALGRTEAFDEGTRETTIRFVSSFFAPIFFAGLALHVDFIAGFEWLPVLSFFVIACAGKIVGCSLGARIARFSPRESLAVGFGMNSRGAMEIILGTSAFAAGLIGRPVFVALVITALVTSVMAGVAMRTLLSQGLAVRNRFP